MINHAIQFIGADDRTTMEELLTDYVSLQQEAANEKTSCDRLTELAAISSDLARRVATHPCAPPALLGKLANSKDAITRSHVTANPNTPTEVLLHLGCEFPKQLLNNPIFSLLWLENPNLIDKMPFATLMNLLQQKQVPVFLLEQTASHLNWEVQLAVATNSQTPRTTLEQLVRCSNINVAQSAQLHVNWAGEITEGWEEIANKAILSSVLHPKNLRYIKELAKISLIPEFILERLPETWYSDKLVEVVASVANNLPHLLEKLARNNRWEFRAAVATNPSASVSLLIQLAGDEDLMVRKNVARNPNTPVSLLMQLAGDNYGTVRREVAKNPHTPGEILEQLALDQYDLVRQAVSQNPNTLKNHLKQLAVEQHSLVGTNVAQRPKKPVSVLEQSKNPDTPESLLERLAKDKTVEVRCGVGQNPKTSERLLKHLLSDRAWRVRLVAMVAYLAKNPNVFPALLEQQLAKNTEEWEYKATQFTTACFIRLLILLHPQISGKALTENSRSLAWLERYAIAQHPNTPLDTLHTLAVDANRIVRAAAKTRLQTRHQSQ